MRSPLARVALLTWALVGGWAGTACAAEEMSAVAVFPVQNLSGAGVPGHEIRQWLVDRLTATGVRVLPDDALDRFAARHRIRYLAGVDAGMADRLRQEEGVDGVVIVSVELSSEILPPRVALLARLVSLRAAPTVVWATDVGLAGDDAPGLLQLGVVNDHTELLGRALERVAGSLVSYVTTGTSGDVRKAAPKFRPKVAYRGVTLEPNRVHSVAVLPFFNLSGRRNAGEALALLFVGHLSAFGGFRVIDPGEVRQQLLQARVIMDGGISIADADVVGTVLDADFVLAGRVLYYDDFEVPEADPRVEFSTVVIDRRSRKLVWSSHSYNRGHDGVRFFGRGRSGTAHAMATQMVQLATEALAGAGR